MIIFLISILKFNFNKEIDTLRPPNYMGLNNKINK